jgi:hypothetical protein
MDAIEQTMMHQRNFERVEPILLDIIKRSKTPLIQRAIQIDRVNFLKNGLGGVHVEDILAETPGTYGQKLFLNLAVVYSNVASLYNLQGRFKEEAVHLKEVKSLFEGLFDPLDVLKCPPQYKADAFRDVLYTYAFIVDAELDTALKKANDLATAKLYTRWIFLKNAFASNDKVKEKKCRDITAKQFSDLMEKTEGGYMQGHYDHSQTRNLHPSMLRSPTQHFQCANCGKKEEFKGQLKQCSRCKKVRYCGQECQLKHWKDGHKDACNK